MSEKNNNQFRFSLYQEEVLLGEKVFDADIFNPFTRYSIDVRAILPQTITRLQKLLSRKKYDVVFDVGGDKEYNLLQIARNIINSYPDKVRRSMIYNPKPAKHYIDDKIIRGVECKIGLYINNNPIVERMFYVDGFNPVVRYSVDVIDEVVWTTELILEHIKKVDIKNTWDDYDLINKRGLSITQIRELSSDKRAYLIRSINR